MVGADPSGDAGRPVLMFNVTWTKNKVPALAVNTTATVNTTAGLVSDLLGSPARSARTAARCGLPGSEVISATAENAALHQHASCNAVQVRANLTAPQGVALRVQPGASVIMTNCNVLHTNTSSLEGSAVFVGNGSKVTMLGCRCGAFSSWLLL